MTDIYDDLKICVDVTGKYLGAHIGAIPETTHAYLSTRPNDDRDLWDFNNESWIPYVEPPVLPPQEMILSSPNGVLVRVTVDDNAEVWGEKIE